MAHTRRRAAVSTYEYIYNLMQAMLAQMQAQQGQPGMHTVMVQSPNGTYGPAYPSPLAPSPYAHQLPSGSAQVAAAGMQQIMYAMPHHAQVGTLHPACTSTNRLLSANVLSQQNKRTSTPSCVLRFCCQSDAVLCNQPEHSSEILFFEHIVVI